MKCVNSVGLLSPFHSPSVIATTTDFSVPCSSVAAQQRSKPQINCFPPLVCGDYHSFISVRVVAGDVRHLIEGLSKQEAQFRSGDVAGLVKC